MRETEESRAVRERRLVGAAETSAALKRRVWRNCMVVFVVYMRKEGVFCDNEAKYMNECVVAR
jgi:hypothetical protein